MHGMPLQQGVVELQAWPYSEQAGDPPVPPVPAVVPPVPPLPPVPAVVPLVPPLPPAGGTLHVPCVEPTGATHIEPEQQSALMVQAPPPPTQPAMPPSGGV